jgi:hypothetical protein
MAPVRQSLDDPAIDHTRQFQAQGIEAGDPALDFRQPGLGDRVG